MWIAESMQMKASAFLSVALAVAVAATGGQAVPPLLRMVGFAGI